MHPQIAFILYLAVGCILIFMFLLLCVRVSVYIEDTCPTRFCVRRQQRKMRKKLFRRILYPDEPDTDSPRPASPSEDNITADIICQPYIYRDAYSTGLTGLGRTLDSGRPIGDSPSDLVIAHRIIFRRPVPSTRLLSSNQSQSTHNEASVDEINLERRNNGNSASSQNGDGDDDNHHHHHQTHDNDDDDDGVCDDLESLPPAYSNLADLNSVSVRIEDETGGGGGCPLPLEDEPPPPSYYECVKFPLPEFNSGLDITTITTTTITTTTITSTTPKSNEQEETG